jgi:hypothetical protein
MSTSTISAETMKFITAYIQEYTNSYVEAYGEPKSDEEKDQVDTIKSTIQDAMIAMAEQLQAQVPEQEQTTTEPDIKVLLGEIQSLKSQLKPKPAVTQQQQQAEAKSNKGAYNISAFNAWTKEYFVEHPGIKALPPNLWKNLCAKDPEFKAKYQVKADEFNAANGRVSTKGSTRAVTGPNEYTKAQQYAKSKIAEYGFPRNIYAQVMKASGWIKGSKMTCADVSPAIDAFLENYEAE